jgi:PAS domain-containing protein
VRSLTKTQTSFRIDTAALKAFHYALIEEGKSMSSVVEQLIKQWLARRTTEVPAGAAGVGQSLTSQDVAIIRHLAARMGALLDRANPVGIPPSAALAFLDSAPVVAVIKDAEGSVLWGNQKYLKLTGKTLAQVRGKDAIQIWGKEYGEVIRRHENQVIAERGEGKVFIEAIAVGRLSRLRETFRFPIFDPSGEKVIMLGVLALDLAEAVRAYDEFVAPDRAVEIASVPQKFFEFLPVPVVVLDGSGVVRYANSAYASLLSKSSLNLPRTSIQDLWPPSIAAAIRQECTLAQASSVGRVAFERLPVKRKMIRELMTLRFPISTQSGTLTAAVSIDLQRVYEAAELLKDIERGGTSFAPIEAPTVPNTDFGSACPPDLLDRLLDTMPIVATLKDLQGRIVYGNGAYRTLINRPFEDVHGGLPTHHWPARVGSMIMKLDQWVRDQGSPILSVERIPVQRVPRNRLTIRFPIRGQAGIEATASLGFDFEALSANADRLAAAAMRRGRAGIYAA